MSSHKVAIDEADETNVQQALDSLLIFPLDAQTVFSGDDRLDVPCFGQSHHVQVVIDHDQLILQICAGKVVRFDAEDGFGATVRTQFAVAFTFASKDMYSLDSCIVT